MTEEGRAFPDVFPDCRIPGRLSGIFGKVLVSKVVMCTGSTTLKVFLVSEYLIPRKDMDLMEYLIKEHVFPGTGVEIRIFDQYHLSSQYTLQNLTEEYWDSILYEVKKKSQVEYSLLSKCQWGAEGDVLTILLEDSFLAKKKAPEIKEYLESSYQERFGISLKVGFNYTEEQKQAFYAANRHKLKVEVASIMEQLDKISEESDEEKSEEKKKEEKRKLQQEKRARYLDQREQNAYFRKQPRKADPDVFYGKYCDGDITPIQEIADEIGEVVIHGQLRSLETKEIPRIQKTIVMFQITDFTDTITCKIFVKDEELPEFMDHLKKGNFYKVKGMAVFDKFDKEVGISSITGMKSIPDFRNKRVDTALEKRVELHLHTMMSDMDSVVDIKKVINRAKEWGHPAMAITDHGVLQAFPIANHCISKDEPFKIIYGVEGYFVDDMKDVVINSKNQSLRDSYVVFDIETTGFSPVQNKIIEIGAVKVENGKITGRFSEFVNPKEPIPFRIEELTSITDDMVKDAPEIDVILPKFLEFCQSSCLVAHNCGV